MGLKNLGLSPTPGFDKLVTAFAEMEVSIPPDPAPGVAEALAVLAERHRLGIVSDTIVTPGAGLRRILANADLLHLFEPQALVFSDEIGASKPEPSLFLHAARELGVAPGALVHVGDREENDIEGPHQAGCRAVLYTGVVDRRTDGTRADGVCEHHDSMPALVTSLEREIVEKNDE
jgi:putative hydrolase of the HAD superfamily